MATGRPTDPAPPNVCSVHSGIHERVRDLESRADKAEDRQRDLLQEITDIKVQIGRSMGGLGAILVVVQIALAFALKAID